MLSYRKQVLILLFSSVIVIALGWIFALLNIWWVLLLIILNISALAAGAFRICSGLYVSAHCRGETQKPYLALTFDDGPHTGMTPVILDILKKNKIKAGFFLTGKQIINNKYLVRRISNEGHIIGNHSYSHANTFGFFSTRAVIRDLEKNEQLIHEITGKKCMLFRPPFGVTNPHIAKAVRYLGYSVVGWSIRSLDTMTADPEMTIKRIKTRLGPGHVILLHDSRLQAAVILDNIIRIAKEKGYEFVSPDILLQLKAYR